jgi:aspartate aminotransferase-like enzyme
MQHNKLFIPGPTHVTQQNLNAQTQSMIGHRSDEYAELHRCIVDNLKILLDTQNDIFIATNSATGCMEAAIRNTVENNVLCLVNGAFSERWAKIAESNGKNVTRLEATWGSAITAQQLKEELTNNTYEAVTVVLSETSTGARAPIEAISNVMKEFPHTLLLVDGVSIVGGEQVDIDKWGIDVCLFGTQKALALPPGVSFMSVSPSAIAKANHVTNRGYYFDFKLFSKYAAKNQTPTTPPITLLYAVQQQLQTILLEESKAGRFLRHQVLAKRVRDWGKQYFTIFTEKKFLVDTLTTFQTPENFDTESFIQQAARKGIILSNGYGKLKNKTFRIGHMGDHSIEDIEKMLETIDPITQNHLTPNPTRHEVTHR